MADGSTPPPAPLRLARRSVTESFQRKGRAELVRLRLVGQPPPDYWRPATRGDCEWCETCQSFRDAQNTVAIGRLPCGHDAALAHVRSRPCLFVACKQHLYLNHTQAGSVQLNFPELEPAELNESCCLDVAARGGTSLEEISATLNVTRERVRQIEATALAKLNTDAIAHLLRR